MFDKIADRRNEEERQERRLERRFSVFFVVLMKRVLCAAVLVAVLFGMAAWGNWAVLESREEKEQTVGEILEQEEIAMLIREVILVKGEDLRSLKPETEVLDDRVCLRLSDGTERVAINVFEAQAGPKQEELILTVGSKWEEFEALWQRCEMILHEEGIEDYGRFSWHMTDGAQRERETLGKFILYQAADGKRGFFRQNGEVLYQVETRGRPYDDGQDREILQEKEQIKRLSITEGKNSEQDGWREPECGLYGVMLWKLWDGRMPAWGVSWDSTVMRDAAYRSLYARGEVPAWEEIGRMEELFVSLGENERLETFSDLEKFPCLKKLQLYGGNPAQINFDLTKEMLPELEELKLCDMGLENLSFLEGFPQLKVLSVFDCGLEDISGIECQGELREITLSRNVVRNLDLLKNCKKAKSLTVAYGGIKDISVLASLPELSEVKIYKNEISDLSPLRNLTKLRKIDASYNRISDIKPLEGLAELDSLDLDYNEIQDIRAIGSLPMLRYLRLYHNQIQDFSPALKLTQLWTLSVGENPGQNHIGDLVFLPRVVIGNGFCENEEMQQEAQEVLNQFYADEKLTAQDMAKGDLNGDGIVDLAITGLDETVNSEADDGRKVYPFLGQAGGGFQALTPIGIRGPNSGGTHGDPYRGILVTDGRLVAKDSGGSNWYWESTEIYEYENGEMKETWELGITGYAFCGCDFYISNIEDGSYRRYAVASDGEEESRPLLYAQGGETPSPVEKEFADQYAEYQERTGITLPEFDGRTGRPEIGAGWYDYQLHDQLYGTHRQTGEVLLEAAEKYLSEYQELPAPYYPSEEILENYRILTGVEVPEFFLIGQDRIGSGIKILAYSGCQQQENGSYEHEISQWGISEDEWMMEQSVYFREQ